MDQADGADEAVTGRRTLADLGVASGTLVALVVILIGVGAWIGVRAWTDRVPAPAGDLARFDEIDLGPVAGADVTVGVTRSNRLPIVVHRSGRAETSLAIADADTGTLLDGGPIPVEGWIGDGYPRASDRYVAMIADVCGGKPREGDAGLECTGDGMPVGVQLSVYDIEAEEWSTLPLDVASNQMLILRDVDGATATIEEYPSDPDANTAWITVDLSKPLALGPSSPTSPIRPNPLATSQGHIDGFGWKARNADGGDATWVGTVDGREETVEISLAPLRHLYGAGRCVLIGSYRSEHLDHLHRLCADR